MKSLLLAFFVAVSFTVAVVRADESAEKSLSFIPAIGGRIGVAAGTTAVVCHFRCVNNGSSSVEITDIRPTCNCTTAVFPSGQIAPGVVVDVAFEVNTTDMEGDVDKVVPVYCVLDGAMHKSHVVLRLHISRLPRLVSRPASLEIAVSGDYTISATIELQGPFRPVAADLRVACPLSWVRVTPKWSDGRLIIRFDGNVPIGSERIESHIAVVDKENRVEEVDIPVSISRIEPAR